MRLLLLSSIILKEIKVFPMLQYSCWGLFFSQMAGFVWLPREQLSLKASSRVCRSFLHRTRVHLLRQFCIDVTRSFLQRTLRDVPTVSLKTGPSQSPNSLQC